MSLISSHSDARSEIKSYLFLWRFRFGGSVEALAPDQNVCCSCFTRTIYRTEAKGFRSCALQLRNYPQGPSVHSAGGVILTPRRAKEMPASLVRLDPVKCTVLFPPACIELPRRCFSTCVASCNSFISSMPSIELPFPTGELIS
jgi:hypothetical protein